MHSGTGLAALAGLGLFTMPLAAEPRAAMEAFATNCFSPLMTAARADEVLASTGARVDFYDLDPFSRGNDPSPVAGRDRTPETDRRCEVAFDGDFVEDAIAAAAGGLEAEGIRTEAPVPDSFARIDGAAFVGARQLNPSRMAIVQVGTRPGPNGVETYINVERLTREASSEALQ